MSHGKITRQELSLSVNEELNKIGNLSELETSDKSDLVGAINSSMKITDSSTSKKYRWGVENGFLYIEEVN